MATYIFVAEITDHSENDFFYEGKYFRILSFFQKESFTAFDDEAAKKILLECREKIAESYSYQSKQIYVGVVDILSKKNLHKIISVQS